MIFVINFQTKSQQMNGVLYESHKSVDEKQKARIWFFHTSITFVFQHPIARGYYNTVQNKSKHRIFDDLAK